MWGVGDCKQLQVVHKNQYVAYVEGITDSNPSIDPSNEYPQHMFIIYREISKIFSFSTLQFGRAT